MALQQVGAERQDRQPGDREHRPEHPCVARRDTAVRHRPEARALHQGVRLAFDDLVERRRAAGDEGRADDHVEQPPHVARVAARHHVAGNRRYHDEHVEPRLGERDEIRRARRRGRNGGRVQVGFHRWLLIATPSWFEAYRSAFLGARGAPHRSVRSGPHPQALPLALRAHGGSGLSLALGPQALLSVR